MARLWADNAEATLASGINDSTTTIVLASGNGALFPSPTGGDYFILTLTQAGTETSWEKVKVTARSTDTLTVVRGQEGSTAAAWSAADKAELRSTAAGMEAIEYRKPFHGVASRTDNTIAFDYATLTFTIAPTGGSFDIYYQGTKYSKGSTTVVLNTVGLNFVYFNSAGTLVASATPWSLTAAIPVATVFLTATTGGTHALSDERHNSTRDLDWHMWAHSTIGARYKSGLLFTNSGGTPATFSFAGGTIEDEDIVFDISDPQTSCRVWYQTGASTYSTPVNTSSYLFSWSGSAVQYANAASSYALTATTAGRFINVWVYASTDVNTPIYAVVETLDSATGGYTTAAAARAINPPNLAAFPLTPELKLLYRVIYQGSGAFVEATDYRSTATLPAGGTTSTPSAASISYTAGGGISATNVQGAIEELDTEKASLAGATFTGNVTQNGQWTYSYGTPGTGKVLTSGSAGAATWEAANPTVAGDPNWANVSLLLHTRTGLPFVDSSTTGHTLSSLDNAAYSALSPFSVTGFGSIAFDGSGDGVSIAATAALQFTADYTIEFFVRLNTTSGVQDLLGNLTGNVSTHWTIIANAGYIDYYPSGTGTYIHSTAVTTGTWYHVAAVRSGTSVRLFLNGVNVGSTATVSGTLGSDTLAVWLGRRTSGTNWLNGNIAAVRITKGVALYPSTTTFTPPSVPYLEAATLTYQTALVAGTNIKMLNGVTLMGAGNIEITPELIPQNSQSAAYTLVLADAGKHILHPSADTTARTFTIPANSSVPYRIGTAITFVNQASAGVVTIAITTDTMRLAGAGTTGSRTLAANGVATAIKLTATEWIISGTGLT